MSDTQKLVEKIRVAKIKVKEATYAADQNILTMRKKELKKLESAMDAQVSVHIAGPDCPAEVASTEEPTEEPTEERLSSGDSESEGDIENNADPGLDSTW